MKSSSYICEHLTNLVSASRFEHSLRVADTAKKLAQRWQVNTEQAYLAGLIHDSAKRLTPETAAQKGVVLPPESKEIYALYPSVWHALMGPFVCKTLWEVDDRDVLSAVRWHTTGSATLSRLDELIFVADFIEPGRSYPESKVIAEIAETSLEQAVFAVSCVVLKSLMFKTALIHPETVACRNAYSLKLNSDAIYSVRMALQACHV